jgi:hypothetical protein
LEAFFRCRCSGNGTVGIVVIIIDIVRRPHFFIRIETGLTAGVSSTVISASFRSLAVPAFSMAARILSLLLIIFSEFFGGCSSFGDQFVDDPFDVCHD